MRTAGERARDVRRLIDAARELVRERLRYVDAIAEATGLSRANVELGLTRHLEHDARDEEIAALVARAGDVAAVHVVLSANVFVAPLRAIAIARAASEAVTIRPSRRDPVLARALVALADDPAVVLAEDRAIADVPRGAIHVYGRDSTIDAVRAAARPGVVVRGHGAGMGIAVVSPQVEANDAAAQIADDVVPFDQRGCLSPRVVVAIGDEARAEALARALGGALDRAGDAVPRGALTDDERAAAVRYAQALDFSGIVLRGAHAVVGVSGAVTVPPTGRHLHVTWARDSADAAQRIAPFAPYVVAVGCDAPSLAEAVAPPHARRSPLGRMQRPPLDGPVDLR